VSGADPAFHILGFEWVPTGGATTSRGTPLSGRLRLLTPDEVAFVVAEYRDDQVVVVGGDRLVSTAASAPDGQLQALSACTDNYWGCVKDCIASIIPNLPWVLRLICEEGLTACVFSVGTDPIACGAALGCLGGTAAACGWSLCTPC
jgi:hypothetical protein